MQEHIRRAHPEHYIAKLPATEESFMLMINTPPSERPQPQQLSAASSASNHQAKPYSPDRIAYYREDYSRPGTPRPYEEYPGAAALPAATNAAAALASLHHYKGNSDWEVEGVSCQPVEQAASQARTHANRTCRSRFRILKEIDCRDRLSSFPLYTSAIPILPVNPSRVSILAGPGIFSHQLLEPRLLADHLHYHPFQDLLVRIGPGNSPSRKRQRRRSIESSGLEMRKNGSSEVRLISPATCCGQWSVTIVLDPIRPSHRLVRRGMICWTRQHLSPRRI